MENTESLEEPNVSEGVPKITKVAMKLYGFLQRCHLNTNIQPTPGAILSVDFSVNDMTDDGTPFGLQFTLASTDINEINDDDASIEAFCFNYVVNVGTALLTEKASRLLQHNSPATKSKIYIP